MAARDQIHSLLALVHLQRVILTFRASMSHVISTHLVDALRGAEELPTDQQQAVQNACVAGQRHLQAYTQAQLAAAEAARAGHRLLM